MKEKFLVFKNRWKKINVIRKVVAIIALLLILCNIGGMSVYCYNVWKTNPYAIIAIGIVILYLYPFLYAFVKEIKKKDRKIQEILKIEEKKEVENKLTSFEYYTLPRFFAELSKQFSSMWVFAFLQVIFIQIPEYREVKSEVTVGIYIAFIISSILICMCVYAIAGGSSFAISTSSLGKKRHIEYIMRERKML